MTIITRKRSDNFAIIPNEVANDDSVSFESRGLLVYLLAKPNDWRVSVKNIQRAGRIGRDKVYRLLNELIGAGYIVREIRRSGDGRINEHEYIVYDSARVAPSPRPEKPEMAALLPENPEAGEPDTDNADAYKEQDSHKESPQTPHDFHSFIEAWPDRMRTSHRASCEAWYRKAVAQRPGVEVQLSTAAERYRKACALRGDPGSVFGFFENDFYLDFCDGPPEITNDGQFLITPGREEWGAWVEDVRARHGALAVDSMRRIGKCLQKRRWPTRPPLQQAAE